MPYAFRTSRDLVALAALALLFEQPLHPYGIQQLIRERHKDFADGKPRALYHAVERLAKEGLIQPVETVREGRRPERTVYRVTDAGRDELEAWLTYLLATPGEPAVLAAALSLLLCISSEEARRALSSRAVVAELNMTAFETVDAALRGKFGLPRHTLIEHEFQMALARAELEWVRGFVAELESGRIAWEPGTPFRGLKGESTLPRLVEKNEPAPPVRPRKRRAMNGESE